VGAVSGALAGYSLDRREAAGSPVFGATSAPSDRLRQAAAATVDRIDGANVSEHARDAAAVARLKAGDLADKGREVADRAAGMATQAKRAAAQGKDVATEVTAQAKQVKEQAKQVKEQARQAVRSSKDRVVDAAKAGTG